MPKPYKGNLSDNKKLCKWFLKDPVLPSVPFSPLGQPWVTITSVEYFDVIRKNCTQHLASEKVFGEARFLGELRTIAMMSQEVVKEITEEVA